MHKRNCEHSITKTSVHDRESVDAYLLEQSDKDLLIGELRQIS